MVGSWVESQALADEAGQQSDGHLVVAPLRDDDVGVALGGFDELQVHGLQHPRVAFHHVLRGAAAFHDVALDDPYEAFVGVGVHEHLQVHLRPQLRVAQGEDAFHDDHVPRLGVDGLRLPGAGQVGVGGLFDALALFQQGEVLGQERPLEGVGVVEVDELPLLQGDVAVVLVVGVLGEQHHFPCGQAFYDFPHDGGLARTGPACNTDN